MELVAITLARVVTLLEAQSWDPFGKTSSVEAFQKLGGRYSFAKVPQTFADVDFQKGVELSAGKFGDIVVDRLTVFMNGIVIDTRSSTDDCEKVLEDILNLAREAFGATVKPRRRQFVSQFIFRSDLQLTLLNPVLNKIASHLTKRVSDDMNHPYTFEPTGVWINADLSQTKIAPAMFAIERRAEVPFTENTYFASAPLRTPEHLELVQQFEASLGA